ncbi:uncharacterized protein V2V93DRAFT_372363 [Kockiozyma suomiensis]|uniref:uncharacterized protein n=1 Tax=Kockiozyma suomiensis TaxID=1337062 RepID=UPI0033442B5F
MFVDPKDFKQVWFPGVHVNIWGGKLRKVLKNSNHFATSDKKSQTANVLSDGPLIWMVSQVCPFLEFDREFLIKHIQNGRMTTDMRIFSAEGNREERHDGNVWYRGPINDNSKEASSKFGIRYRSVLGYTDSKKPRVAATTNEFLHQSVLDRGNFLTEETNIVWQSDEYGSLLEHVYWNAIEDQYISGKPQRQSLGEKEITIEIYTPCERRFWEEKKQCLCV